MAPACSPRQKEFAKLPRAMLKLPLHHAVDALGQVLLRADGDCGRETGQGTLDRAVVPDLGEHPHKRQDPASSDTSCSMDLRSQGPRPLPLLSALAPCV